MRAAHLAGIAVFATGGIGGVHRGASDSFDVSSDIDELAATPVAVVAGPPAERLALALSRAPDEDARQLLLARATGNYKRGNER